MHTDEAAIKNGGPGRNLVGLVLASRLVAVADKNNDETVSRQEWTALA